MAPSYRPQRGKGGGLSDGVAQFTGFPRLVSAASGWEELASMLQLLFSPLNSGFLHAREYFHFCLSEMEGSWKKDTI